MVFCIVGIVVFAILGIFSAKYRYYFKQSLHCISRQIQLKPCDTNFDNMMKAKISVGLGKLSPTLGRFIYKHFVLLSWVLIILMFASIALMGLGVYNYWAYGNCNGPNSSDFCIFNAFSGKDLKLINYTDAPYLGNKDAIVKIVEVGCFSCPYTKNAESFRNQIIDKYGGNVTFIFKDVPILSHNNSLIEAEAAKCSVDQNKYWEYHDKLFENQGNITVDKLKTLASDIGMNSAEFNSCLDSRKYKSDVEKDYQDGIDSGIYATPTYFVDGKPIVGIKAFADLENIVVTEIIGSCPQ